MSDEKHKTQEVKDEELDKVSGGVKDMMEDGRHLDNASHHIDPAHKHHSGIRDDLAK